ncbi:MAG: hypothetical protein V3W41_13690 [Planctomycetota bacterium]
MTRETRVVDNRVFLTGLDELYRTAMMQHESSELLTCARRVAEKLKAQPANLPVAGYYVKSKELTEFFLLMKALQEIGEDQRPEVETMPEYQRLLAVTSSALYGRPAQTGKLLPLAINSLTQALGESENWSLQELVKTASKVARGNDDDSIVGLAALAKDALMVVATSESVTLFTLDSTTSAWPGRREPPRYLWKVDADLSERATRFVETFNALFVEDLPRPGQHQAEAYWRAARSDTHLGRCVCLGRSFGDHHYYHWAIRRSEAGGYEVDEFWHAERWTTARYRESIGYVGIASAPGF